MTLLLLLFSFRAFAETEVGFWAKYKISILHSDGRSEQTVQTKEIVAFDESTGYYLVKQTDSSPTIGDIVYNVEHPGFMSPDEGKWIVDNCASQGGKFMTNANAAMNIAACKFIPHPQIEVL
jgi:hypothetical protein